MSDFQSAATAITATESPLQPSVGPSELRRLDRAFLHGLAWTGTTKWLMQVVSWVGTLLLARLLLPEDYGIIGMTAIFLGFLALVSEFGIGSAIVVFRQMGEDEIGQLHTLSLLMGVAAALVAAVAAEPLSRFFRTPALVYVVPVLGLGFVASGMKAVPYALLRKDLRYSAISAIDLGQSVAQTVMVLGLALLGWGYWALAVGNLAGAIVGGTLPLWFYAPALRRIRPQSIRQMLTFSRCVLLSRMFWYGYSNADFLIAGRVLGRIELGFYSMAWNIAMTPVEKITTLLTGVAPAVLARIQDDRSAMRRYLSTTTEALCSVVVPASIGIALVSEDVVPVLLGSRWTPSIASLQLLCLYGAIRAVAASLMPFIQVLKDVRWGMWYSLACFVVFPPCFYIASSWGPVGIAAVWVLVYPIFALVLAWRLMSLVEMRTSALLRAVGPYLIATAAMAVAVLWSRRCLGFVSPLTRLGTVVGIGMLIYVAIVLALRGSRLKASLALLRRPA